ncbi:pentatricopeptide repeat-containing protein [Cucumis melo var. makuwa]|uniref:Pentatricopeptide repeat-containing protein n=2 Tax=Cucumis melo TaxID=3656 RepID=A0A5D3CFP0_CUCMM|nr:pentatricopeptide repeat-containing protein At3g18970 [Cucumis melo]TYK10180.1 pentatricopeptide repeat-containing protein [Cucumis melo var. makuwa]
METNATSQMHLAPRLSCINHLSNIRISSLQLLQIHAQFITNGFKSPSPYAKLITHLCKKSSSESIAHAHLIFRHHQHSPNLFLFNTLIRCAPPQYSISIFANWVSTPHFEFDDFTFIFVLGACARAPSVSTLMIGRQIHTHILKRGIVSNIWAQTTMIHFYSTNKDVGSARKVFDEMSVRNSVTWNAMIAGYCSQSGKVSQKYARDALELFRGMLVESTNFEVKPTDTTMVCILSAASHLGMLETGVCVHAYIKKTIDSPEKDVFIGTGLVNMYSKCGLLSSASSVFKQMKQRNVLTWTSMATGLAVHGRGKEALELLDAMGAHGVKPNAVTFTSLLSACCHGGLIEEGLHLFRVMERKFGVVPQMQHYGCIVDLLGRSGHLREAYELILEMPMEPDGVLWRSLLSSCMLHGDVEMGERVGKLLVERQGGESFDDEWCVGSEDFVALSNVYASAERWDDVEALREEMKIKGIENKAGFSSVQTTGSQGLVETLL